MLGDEQLEQPVLGVIGVLVLVDEDVAEGAAPAVADLLVELHHVDRADQQVVEVHRVGGEHPLLVEGVDLGGDLLEDAALGLGEGGGVDQFVLGAGDLRADRPRRVALRVDLQLRHAAFQHPQRVRLVVDREGARVAEPLGVGAQHPGAGGVEGRHPHRPGRAADQLLDPLLHLVCRLVGEGDREDLARPGRAGRQQVGDPVGEDPGLARAGAGEDEQRPFAVADGGALGVVEVGQQPLGAIGAGLGRRPLIRRLEHHSATRLPLTLTSWPGLPTTVAPGETSWTTTVLAPTLAPSPIAIGPSSLAPAPIVTSSPTVGWRLPRCRAGPAQGHSLVERHPVADLGGLADHHPGAVVDEEGARRSSRPGGSPPRSPRGPGRRSSAAPPAPPPRTSRGRPGGRAAPARRPSRSGSRRWRRPARRGRGPAPRRRRP